MIRAFDHSGNRILRQVLTNFVSDLLLKAFVFKFSGGVFDGKFLKKNNNNKKKSVVLWLYQCPCITVYRASLVADFKYCYLKL